MAERRDSSSEIACPSSSGCWRLRRIEEFAFSKQVRHRTAHLDSFLSSPMSTTYKPICSVLRRDKVEEGCVEKATLRSPCFLYYLAPYQTCVTVPHFNSPPAWAPCSPQ